MSFPWGTRNANTFEIHVVSVLPPSFYFDLSSVELFIYYRLSCALDLQLRDVPYLKGRKLEKTYKNAEREYNYEKHYIIRVLTFTMTLQ